MNPVKQLKISLGILLLLVSLGTAGYMVIEGWRFLDSFYMTVITLGTVGFKEVHDLSDAGKAEREAMRQRGEFLMFMDAEHCPRLEFLTGYAGNVAVRLDETLSPTRPPARQAATPGAPRATRAPR